MSTETIKQVATSVHVWRDDHGDNNPRDWDNLGTMCCNHRRYSLGDPGKHNMNADDVIDEVLSSEVKDKLEAWKDREYRKRVGPLEGKDYEVESAKLEKDFAEKRRAAFDEVAISLPLYLYDHSGITMNTTGFSCRWDSGMVGIIYITREKILKEFSRKVLTKSLREKVLASLKIEVETYDHHLTGAVYGFSTKDAEGEVIDSCGGFFGYDHKASGLLDAVCESLPENDPLRDPNNWKE